MTEYNKSPKPQQQRSPSLGWRMVDKNTRSSALLSPTSSTRKDPMKVPSNNGVVEKENGANSESAIRSSNRQYHQTNSTSIHEINSEMMDSITSRSRQPFTGNGDTSPKKPMGQREKSHHYASFANVSSNNIPRPKQVRSRTYQNPRYHPSLAPSQRSNNQSNSNRMKSWKPNTNNSSRHSSSAMIPSTQPLAFNISSKFADGAGYPLTYPTCPRGDELNSDISGEAFCEGLKFQNNSTYATTNYSAPVMQSDFEVSDCIDMLDISCSSNDSHIFSKGQSTHSRYSSPNEHSRTIVSASSGMKDVCKSNVESIFCNSPENNHVLHSAHASNNNNLSNTSVLTDENSLLGLSMCSSFDEDHHYNGSATIRPDCINPVATMFLNSSIHDDDDDDDINMQYLEDRFLQQQKHEVGFLRREEFYDNNDEHDGVQSRLNDFNPSETSSIREPIPYQSSNNYFTVIPHRKHQFPLSALYQREAIVASPTTCDTSLDDSPSKASSASITIARTPPPPILLSYPNIFIQQNSSTYPTITKPRPVRLSTTNIVSTSDTVTANHPPSLAITFSSSASTDSSCCDG